MHRLRVMIGTLMVSAVVVCMIAARSCSVGSPSSGVEPLKRDPPDVPAPRERAASRAREALLGESPHLPATELSTSVTVARGFVVNDQGTAVEGATVWVALGDSGAARLRTSTTDVHGHFEINLPTASLHDGDGHPNQSTVSDADTAHTAVGVPCMLRLGATLTSGNAASRPRIIECRPGSDSPEVILVLRAAAAIDGRVVGSDGVALPGALALVMCVPRDARTWESGSADASLVEIRTDDEGRFHDLVPAGEVRVFARRDRIGEVYGSSVRALTESGSPTSVGDVTVGGGSLMLHVKVQDEDEEPVSGAVLRFAPDDCIQTILASRGTWWEHAKTNSAGQADVQLEPSTRPLEFAVGHTQFQPVEVIVDRTGGGPLTVTVTLRRKYEIRVAVAAAGVDRLPRELTMECSISPSSFDTEDPTKYEQLLIDAVPKDFAREYESLARSVDWHTDTSRPEWHAESQEFLSYVTRAGEYAVGVRSGPVTPGELRVSVGPDCPVARVQYTLPAGREVRVETPEWDEHIAGEDWKVWATAPGELGDEWPRGSAEWGVATVRGSSLFADAALAYGSKRESTSRSWWIPWEYCELNYRDINALTSHAGQSEPGVQGSAAASVRPTLRRVAIPSGLSASVTLDRETRDDGTLVLITAQLRMGSETAPMDGWVVEARRRRGRLRIGAVTDRTGAARLRLPPGEYVVDVAIQYAPRSPLSLSVSKDDAAGVHLDIQLQGRAW